MIAALAGAHLAIAVLRFGMRLPVPYSFAQLFDLNSEQSLGTLASTILLLLASLLLFAMGMDARRRRAWDARYWLALSAGFAFLVVDEAVSLHEALGGPVRRLLNTSGTLYYAWVIPYAVVVLALTPYFMRFLRGLPRRTRTDFMVAGAIYLTGAIGLELVEGRLQQTAGFESLSMAIAFMVEESLEMLGVTWFLSATLAYLSARGLPLELAVRIPSVREADREVPLPPWQRADRERPRDIRPPPPP